MPSRKARAPWWTERVWATWRNRDQLQAVEALGAGLVAVDLGQACVDRGISRDGAVDVGEPKEPADTVHHRDHREVPQPGLAELSDVELDVRALDPDQRVQVVGLAPGEPASQLQRVQVMVRPE